MKQDGSLLQSDEQRLNICGQWAFELQHSMADRVFKAQRCGMQRLTVKSDSPAKFPQPALTIEWVAQQGVTDMRHMHADLMRAPGFQPAFHQRGAVEYLPGAVMRDCQPATAGGDDRHFLPVAG